MRITLSLVIRRLVVTVTYGAEPGKQDRDRLETFTSLDPVVMPVMGAR